LDLNGFALEDFHPREKVDPDLSDLGETWKRPTAARHRGGDEIDILSELGVGAVERRQEIVVMDQNASADEVRGTLLDMGERSLEGIQEQIYKGGNQGAAENGGLGRRGLVEPF